MSVRILHLSDIHFCCYKNEEFDLDADLRSEIQIDLKFLVDKGGKVDLILIGGDIVYHGTQEEYKKADDWLKSITDLVGCEIENVLTVPGNHDINRDDIGTYCKLAQNNLRVLRERSVLDRDLQNYSEDSLGEKILFQHLKNYQEFCIRYGVVHQANQPFYWEKDILVGNYVMRIRGVNSAIASNTQDNDKDQKLFLGSMQTTLSRKEGIFYLFLCHHPPDWLVDGEDVEKDINARARIQLFGHKHSFKTDQDEKYLRLSAGAVHPSRQEQDWDPRYNLLEIEANDGKVSVNIWKRVWDKEEKKFKADHTGNVHYDTHVLELDEVERVTSFSPENQKEYHRPPIQEEVLEEKEIETINPENPNPLRKLGFFFFRLSYSDKILIALELQLLDDNDKDLSEVEKSKEYFSRAQQKDALHQLWEKVASKYPIDTLGNNPFKKDYNDR